MFGLIFVTYFTIDLVRSNEMTITQITTVESEHRSLASRLQNPLLSRCTCIEEFELRPQLLCSIRMGRVFYCALTSKGNLGCPFAGTVGSFVCCRAEKAANRPVNVHPRVPFRLGSFLYEREQHSCSKNHTGTSLPCYSNPGNSLRYPRTRIHLTIMSMSTAV